MDEIVAALKIPFVTLPPEQRPPDRTIVLVWAAVGALVASALK